MTETAALGRATARGVGWGTLATALNLSAQIGFMAVMARLLDPADFGLVAMGHIACRFGSYFAQMGLGPALVQRPVLGPRDASVALALALAVGGALALTLFLLAPFAAAAFRAEALSPLLRVMALGLLLGSVAGVPAGLLRRAMRFKALAAVEMTAYLVGYGSVGLGFALAGAGAWSLVAAGLGQGLVALVVAAALARLPLRLGWEPAIARSLWGYGGRLSLTGFLEFFGASLESLAVGRFLGAAPLGFYNRALLLAQLPVEQATGVLTRTAFPALARMHGEPAAMGQAVVLALGVVGLAAGCFGAGLAMAAPDVIGLLLGPRWVEAAPALRWLAVAMPFLGLTMVAGTALDALGALTPKLRAQALVIVLRLAALPAALHYGLAGCAALVLAAEALRFALYLVALRARLPLPGRQLLAAFLRAGAGAGAAALLVAAAGHNASGAPDSVRVVVEVLGGVVALGGAGLLWRVSAAGRRRTIPVAGRQGCAS